MELPLPFLCEGRAARGVVRAVVAVVLGAGLTLANDRRGLLLVLLEVFEGGGVTPLEDNDRLFLGGISLTGLGEESLVVLTGGVGESLFRFLVLRLVSSFWVVAGIVSFSIWVRTEGKWRNK